MTRVLVLMLVAGVLKGVESDSPTTSLGYEPPPTTDSPTVLQHLRQVFASIRSASPGELSYNVTKLCSEGVLRGVCNFTEPQCLNRARCGINEASGDGWGWILPQSEGDFVATFTNGSAFRTEPHVCGTEFKSLTQSRESDEWVMVNGRVKTLHATVNKTVPICCEGYNVTSDYRCAPSCVDPGTCTCLEGYVKNESRCVPLCRRGCENGDCATPDSCVCRPGHRLDTSTQSVRCVPHCPGGCPRTNKCLRPGHCGCEDGYLKDITGHCVSFCPSGCVNGMCMGPNHCVCKDGYRKTNNSSDTCTFYCSKGCSYGRCTGPNQCTCNTGYTRKNSYTCVPYCAWGCTNGDCTEPNQCSCHVGYFKNPNDPHAASCLPRCKKPCVHGECTTPEHCKCHRGYKKDYWDKYTCNPECEHTCKNGECTAPDTCTCDAGHVKVSQYKCKQPLFCPPGYHEEDDRCVPTCSSPCINGQCTAPNVCSCNSGYSMDYSRGCVPVCSTPCHNGTCTAPDRCSCNKGYGMGYTGGCVPICSPPCNNGVCSAPNKCTCNHGYFLDFSGRCIQGIY